MISANKQRLKYVFGDYLSSNVGWYLFNCARYFFAEEQVAVRGHASLWGFLSSGNVVLGQVVFPILMMCIYYFSGFYTQVFKKSRLQELVTTFYSVSINTIILFLITLINDLLDNRVYNYEIILMLWVILFGTVYSIRYLITLVATKNIHNRIWSFDTLIIGNGKVARDFERELSSMKKSLGYNVVGYVNIPNEQLPDEAANLPVYEINDLQRVCDELKIEELLVIPSRHSAKTVLTVVNKLFFLNRPIKILPDMYNILLSRVSLSSISGEPLVDISGTNMSACSENIKRFMDIVLSVLVIVILSPLFFVIGILIKRDSKGAIIYKQERIGIHNKPFNIYKFRTMVEGAEKDGKPMLSTESDTRITKLGLILRKYRIDELPQFYNVLKGDMSLVGPRPERKYYIDLIMKDAPYYAMLHQVRPGITSLGMVKYGYASSVPEMIKRLRYDLIYIENMSLLNDMKILIYTVITVIKGKGI